LLNVADESRPLGLFNVIGNGYRRLGVYASDSAAVNVGLKLGGRTIYSLINVGYEQTNGNNKWLAGLGVGGHVPIDERLFVDIELLASHVNEGELWTDKLNTLSSLRVIGGYELGGALSVFAGPTLNVLATRVGHGEGFGLISGFRLTAEDAATTVRLWPGLVAGFQI
jgi:hypothetical protein